MLQLDTIATNMRCPEKTNAIDTKEIASLTLCFRQLHCHQACHISVAHCQYGAELRNNGRRTMQKQLMTIMSDK